MEGVFLQVLEISIMVSYLIVAVLIIRGCFKKASSSFKCILWMLVGLRLLIPVTISTPFGLVPQVEFINGQGMENLSQAEGRGNHDEQLGQQAGENDSEMSKVERGDEDSVAGAGLSGDKSKVSGVESDLVTDSFEHKIGDKGTSDKGTFGGTMAVGSTTEGDTSGVTTVLGTVGGYNVPENEMTGYQEAVLPVAAIVWLCGMILMLGYMLISWLRLHKDLRTAIPEMVDLQGMQIKIYRTENIASPFLLGVVSPRIYLPYDMNGKDEEYVLAHELMHIRRKDYIWKPLSFVVLSLYWFHPLVWLAYILLGRDIELACDEQVMRKEPDLDRKAYAQALLSCGSKQKQIFICPVAFGESDVKVRVKNVLNYKKPGFWIAVVCAIVSVVVVLMFMTVSDDTSAEGNVVTADADKEAEVSQGGTATQEPSGENEVEGATDATLEPTAEPTAEPTVEPTAKPTIEPTAEPTPTPTATPDPAATPVPTVVPEEWTPGAIEGYTAEESKAIREELLKRIVYKISDNAYTLDVWLDSTDYERGTWLSTLYLNRQSGMKFQSLDVVNHIEAFEMDGGRWLAVTVVPNVQMDGVIFPYEEKASDIMIPVSRNADGAVVLGNYYYKKYNTSWLDDTYGMNYYEESNYSRTRVHLMQADVTHDGIDDYVETFIYLPPETDMTADIDNLIHRQMGVDNILIQVYDGSTATEESLGTPILSDGYSSAHAGNGQMSIVEREGRFFLLITSLWAGQGAMDYEYDVLALDGEGHQYVIEHGEMHSDIREEDYTREGELAMLEEFSKQLAPWLENGRLVVGTDVSFGDFVTTERMQYTSWNFYEYFLRGVK